ncbi:sugar ABC transporter permease [Schaedlerella arabinosiphila]|uniref:Sugar ABC transporter permease n=1 Tax=Schaedlerella arabinosiphila TaxID=2044587 RepID=A0A9X5H6R9_9FIRM|nr:sugar ABC transporter permease [Schaedlerella arabinosiphila]KAI4441300.1 Melibiose/raffinose/stachyose import permease protein MelD [Schaedlerella arabinosiphila]NDO69819.1 sugar ABC transporter permease [Schaedlerella arabinosiphila]
MKRTKLLQRNQILFLFTLPILLMYCLFFIVPLLMGMKNSFTDWSGTSPDYNFIGIGNYIGIFGDERFRNALWFNFKYTFLLTAATMVISLVLALILNQKIKARGLFRSIYFLPAVLSLVTVGLIWNELFYRMIPAIGEATGWGLFQSSWLGSPKLAMYAILIVNLWQGCATLIVLLIAGLQSVPEDLYEAASIDGATAWDKFRAITIPYLIPVLNMVFVTCVKGGLTTFDYIKAMTDGGPMQSTESVGILIYNHAMQEGKFGYSVAESMILFVIIALVSVATMRMSNGKKVGD